MTKFYLNDTGSVYEITVKIKMGTPEGVIVVPADLSQATLLQLKLRKPGMANITALEAQKVTDGKDGKIYRTWEVGDLNVTGTWRGTVYIESPTLKLHSDTLCFDVVEPI